MSTSTHAEVINDVVSALELTGPLVSSELLTKLDELGSRHFTDAPDPTTRGNRFRACLSHETELAQPRVQRVGGKIALVEGAASVVTDTRLRKSKDLVSVTPLETVRHRLERTLGQFSIDLGYSEGTYASFVREGRAPRTAALAAEALMRRQAASDAVFLVRVVKGTPRVTVIDAVETMTLNGRRYLLVPE